MVHSVSCQYRSFNPDLADTPAQQIEEARQSGEKATAAIAALKNAKQQKMIPEKYSNVKVAVGESGLVDHKFELTSE